MELNLPAGVELWEPFTNGGSVALAPDGSKIAFIGTTSGNRQVYIRRLDQFDTVAVRDTSSANAVMFSPDSRAIGVMLITGELRKIGLEDGLLVPLAGGVDVNAGVWVLDTARGTFSRLTRDPTLDHSFPEWTPDGKRVWVRTQKACRSSTSTEAERRGRWNRGVPQLRPRT